MLPLQLLWPLSALRFERLPRSVPVVLVFEIPASKLYGTLDHSAFYDQSRLRML